MAKIKKTTKSTNKSDKGLIEAIAVVIEELSSTTLKVQVKYPVVMKQPIICYNSGKIITNRIKIQEHDLVKIEISANSIRNNTVNGKCRIVYRYPPGSKLENIIPQEAKLDKTAPEE